ncbi:MAG: acyltransferase family protein [Terracidiphilus sp.]|nr:acyltransferase family protein [Terracidiphilus sp.]
MSGSSNPKTGMKYRADIDGLRAVAVLSVFAFHIGGSYIPGGFVGVDVFFVISGYLISTIMFADIAASRFSVLKFYERRIRRIFPALFGMLIVFSVVAWFYLLPTEFVDYAKSLLAATTSASNFYFWQHSGYFDSPTSSPLLHTWSLAVEEQFYILFPVFLIIVRRFFPQRLRIAVVVLFFASLIASVVTVHYNPDTAFYMPYTRAWELLLGTVISLGMLPRMDSAILRNLATFAGIGMIAYAAFFYTPDTPFPGLAALLPCVGSALIIRAGEFGSSIVNRVLSWRPVVFIGLISYSLYLWHWPVIIMHTMGLSVNLSSVLPYRYAALLGAFRFDMWMEIVVSFVLAALSWRFVERPFRSRPLRIQRRPLFVLAAAVMAVLIAFAGSVIFAGGFKGRFSPQAVKVASFLAYRNAGSFGKVGGCFITDTSSSAVLDNDQCLRLVEGKKNYLLIGDSHAGALWSGLTSSLPDDHILLASVSNCKPLVHPSGAPDCKKEMNYIFQSYLPSHKIQGLFLEARWKPGDMSNLTDTIDLAKRYQVPVVVFGPVPEYDSLLPRLLAYSISWNKPGLAHEHLLASSAVIDALMQGMAANTWHVPYISLYRTICSKDGCVEYTDAAHEVPLMNDADHLNDSGSALVAKRLVDSGELR